MVSPATVGAPRWCLLLLATPDPWPKNGADAVYAYLDGTATLPIILPSSTKARLQHFRALQKQRIKSLTGRSH